MTRTKMRKLLISFMFGASLVLTGCSSFPFVYKIDIQQGTVLEDEAVARLQTGMSMHQVNALLGTPPIADPFHAQRWDYIYSMSKGGHVLEKKRLTLYFEGETLSRIDGPHSN